MATFARADRRTVLVVMCAGYFLVLLDVTIVNVALPSIGAGLHAGVTGLQGVVDGYAIALAALMLPAGTLGDRRGHRAILLAGLSLFGAASLGCGLAPATGVLVGFRVLQGVGAALMLPTTLAVITRTFPERAEQARAIGVWAGIGSAALPAGPLLGGALTQGVGWRAVFLLNVPIVAVAVALAARVVPGDGGAVRPGGPVLPLELFRRPVFTTANAVAGTMNLTTLGMLFVVTLYLQDVRGYAALGAGVALVPLFLPLTVIGPLGGRLTARVGPRGPMAAGLALTAAGIAALATLARGSSYGHLLPCLLAWGVGLGVLTPAVVAAAIRAVPAERAGLAAAVSNTARQAGGAIGIAALGAVAGPPAASAFMPGLRLAALIAAGLLVAAVAATLALVRLD